MTMGDEIRLAILGHGVDIVDVSEFAKMLSLTNAETICRYFTDAEIRDAGDGVERLEKLAGRFASKEAVMKAMGVGWGEGVSFTDVEIVVLDSGAPTVRLKRRLLERETALGITAWHISTSHSAGIALASVIAT